MRSGSRFSCSRFFIIIATIFGIVAHSAYLWYNFLFRNTHIITSVGGWFFVLTFFLVLGYLYTLFARPKAQFGLLAFPVIFFLTVIASQVVHLNFAEEQTGYCLRTFHGLTFLLATFFLVLGFISGCTYFLQRHGLKKRRTFLAVGRLPSLEWLEKANRRSARLAILFLGLGIISGFYINWILSCQYGTGKSTIFDPLISGALLLFLVMLLFFIIVSHTEYLQGGQNISLLTIGCFLFLLIFLLLGIFYSKKHWQSFTPDPSPSVQILYYHKLDDHKLDDHNILLINPHQVPLDFEESWS